MNNVVFKYCCILFAGWLLSSHPVFAYSNPFIEINSFPYFYMHNFYISPLSSYQFLNPRVEYTYSFQLFNIREFRQYDPKTTLSHRFGFILYYPLSENLLFETSFSYSYELLQDVTNNLEINPYRGDFVTLTDTTSGDFSLQKPSFHVRLQWNQTSKLKWIAHFQYKLGKGVKNKYTFPINTLIDTEILLAASYKWHPRITMIPFLKYNYSNEKIDLDELQNYPSIYLKRFRGYSKFREYFGALDHYEKAHVVEYGIQINTSPGESLTNILVFTSGLMRQSTFDWYNSKRHFDFPSRSTMMSISDSLKKYSFFSGMASISFGLHFQHNQLVNDKANTLAIDEKINSYSTEIQYNKSYTFHFVTMNTKLQFLLNKSQIKYTDYLSNFLLKENHTSYKISISHSILFNPKWNYNTRLEYLHTSQSTFTFRYFPSFQFFHWENSLKILLSRKKFITPSFDLGYIKNNNLQKNGFIFQFFISFSKEWN